MSKLIKFVILTSCFTFMHAIAFYDGCCFDESGGCGSCGEEEKERVSIDTIRYNTIVNTTSCTEKGIASSDTTMHAYILYTKSMKTDSTDEFTWITSDTLGNVENITHKTIKDYALMRVTDKGLTLNVIHSPNPCLFTVIESSKDTVVFKLNPKIKFLDIIRNYSAFIQSNISPKHKHFIDTTSSSAYYDIVENNHYYCKRRYDSLHIGSEYKKVKKEIAATLGALPFSKKIRYNPNKSRGRTGLEKFELPEKIEYDTNKAGMARIRITILDQSDSTSNSEHITIIRNKKGELIFYDHKIFEDGMLVRFIEDGGAVRDIISGDVKCNFKIIESSGDTVSFSLDPRKEPKRYWEELENGTHDFFIDLIVPKVPLQVKYEEIIYNQWSRKCRELW